MEHASARRRGPEDRIVIDRLRADRTPPTMAEEVVLGLAATPKELPCKYFYDHVGSMLFEKICMTDEYYPWRTENHLLQQVAPEVIAAVAPKTLIELGSGSSRKTRRLLDACEAVGYGPRYMPLDVCPQMLATASGELVRQYAWLDVHALAGDYMLGIRQLETHESPALFVFLGGTIGNFADPELALFLSRLRAVMGPQDHLLLGADLVKDERVLHAAYNDALGLTAAFNLNLLNAINRELDGNFQCDGFAHDARYNTSLARIEMRLVSLREQSVELAQCGRAFSFKPGEAMLTEISRKFTPTDLRRMLGEAGLAVQNLFISDAPTFALALASAS